MKKYGWATVWVATVAVLSGNAWAGDVTTDGLTVNKTATFNSNVLVRSQSSVAPTNGLVLYYSFDTNSSVVADESGNGRTGAVSGATWTANGRMGGAYSFDGIISKIRVGQFEPSVGNGVWSVSVWFRTVQTPGYMATFLNWGRQPYNSTHPMVAFGMFSNGKVWANCNGGTTPMSARACNDGVWHHAVMTYDGSNMVLYVDGAFEQTTAINLSIENVGNGAFVGYRGVYNDDYFSGTLDDVRFYNRVLSATEVQAFMPATGTLTVDGALVANSTLTVRGPLSFTNLSQDAINTINTQTKASVAVTNGQAGVSLAGTFTGTGSGLTSLNASNVTSGTLPLARLAGITSNQVDAATDAAYRDTADLTARAAANNAQARANLSVTNGGVVINGNVLTNGANVSLTAAQVGAVTPAQASNIVQTALGKSQSAVAPTNGLVLYYSFDTNSSVVADESGNGRTGAVSGATWTANGRIGGAYNLDGTNDSITVTGYKGLTGRQAMTVAAWVRSDRYWNGGQYITAWGDGAYWGGAYMLAFNGAGNRCLFGGVGGWTVLGARAPQAEAVWHHVALVTDGTVVSLYIDGTFESSVTTTGLNVRANCDVTIGVGWGSCYLAGAIDDFRIYNRALSAAEVQSFIPVTGTLTVDGALVANSTLTVRGPLSFTNLAQDAINTINTQTKASVAVTNGQAGVSLAGTFTGTGSGLTSLNASNVTSGTLPLARLSGITSNQMAAVTDAAYRDTVDIAARAAASNAQARANLSVTNGGVVINGNILTNGANVTLGAAQVGAVATSDARYLGALTNAAAFDAAGAAAAVQAQLPAIANTASNALQTASAKLSPDGSGAQLIGITAAQVGAATPSQASNIVQTAIAYIPAMGDISMGSFTNTP